MSHVPTIATCFTIPPFSSPQRLLAPIPLSLSILAVALPPAIPSQEPWHPPRAQRGGGGWGRLPVCGFTPLSIHLPYHLVHSISSIYGTPVSSLTWNVFYNPWAPQLSLANRRLPHFLIIQSSSTHTSFPYSMGSCNHPGCSVLALPSRLYWPRNPVCGRAVGERKNRL